MKVIAHRGAVDEALENSFSAFDLAVNAGADRIELDVHLTLDREVVVMHDSDLQRTAGVNRKICELSRNDVRKIKLKNGDAIPFLDEVLERYLGIIEINIELKGADPSIGEATAELVNQHPFRERIIASSFHAEPLLSFRKKSDIPIACLLDSPVSWPLSSLNSPINFMKHVGASIVHPCTRILNENFMDQADARNWTVYTYSELNNSEEHEDADRLWTALAAWGVHGHCTNMPRRFRKWVTTFDGLKIVHKEAEQ